jgi:hypothetical protein
MEVERKYRQMRVLECLCGELLRAKTDDELFALAY